nr:uncharacterized protein LOC112029098 [Quercus suber]
MARKKTKALKEDEEDYISHLPHFVVTDILTRLPFKTLFNCRFVCKTWLHLLKDPGFTQLYHTRVNSNWTILQPKVEDHHLYAVHLFNSSSVIHSSARVKFDTKTHLGFGYYVKHHLVDSCEFVMIRPDINLTPSLWCPRLRFCPKTQVYKVVLLSKHYGVEESNREPTLVYTLGVKGNNVWKRVNVGDDVYGETTGCLAICESPKNDGINFHIWVMKDYGVQVSWAKAYNIEFTMIKTTLFFIPISRIQGLCHNGDILLLYKNQDLVSFNPTKPSFTFHRIEKQCSFQTLPYIPNFSSLRDIVKGEPLFYATSR